MEYFVLSLKWTVGSDYIVFWRPNNAGYTVDIQQAGRYSQEQIINNPTYYDNGTSTLAVPCGEVEPKVWHVVDSGKLHEFMDPRGVDYQEVLAAKHRG